MDILCTVDIATREVSLPEEYVIASYDHLVDVIHFYIEPIEDFSLDTSSIRIAAKGPDGTQHDYAVDSTTVAVESETGYITFDWPIPQGVTEMPLDTFAYGDTGKLIFAVCAEIISGTTITQAWHSDDGIITVVAHLEPENDGEDDTETATNTEMIAALQTDMAALEAAMAALGSTYPTPAETAAEMTETSVIYLYTGSEDDYYTGYWYYYNGTNFVPGGEYGGAIVDDSLSVSGVGADAAATGTAIALKADKADICTEFDATATYDMGEYVLYNGDLYMCTTAVETAGAWDASYWTSITAMQGLGARLDKLVTYQEIEQELPEGIVQIVNPDALTWDSGGTQAFFTRIALQGDGEYWHNPYNSSNQWHLWYAYFTDAYGNQLMLTNTASQQEQAFLTMGGTGIEHFEIENGRTLYYYVGATLTTTFTTTADIAYIDGTIGVRARFGTVSSDEQFGYTYGGKSTSYVAYEGADPVYDYNYVPEMAAYVEEYMQSQGTAASATLFEYYYPTSDNGVAVNAFKYYHERASRAHRDIIRIANFNKFVTRAANNWPELKQELADYSVDICGFEEADLIYDSAGRRLEEYLNSYQFAGGSDHEDYSGGKALVSHWTLDSTEVLTLVTLDNFTQYALKCVMTIPSGRCHGNLINTDCTLSVYVWHGIAYNAAIDGTTYTYNQIHAMEISALLAAMAQDTSDFKVVVADTNCFENGLDTAANTHTEWEQFREAGYTPVLPGYDSTVAVTLASSHYYIADDGKAYCDAAYDQIFIGDNISVDSYKVVDSNLYPCAAASNAYVSDHNMIYADLVFDFDAIMQAKLIDILS